jgi:dTDP-4-dehydrorhamnose reductase
MVMGVRSHILVMGANGMLGHKLMQVLSSAFRVTGAVRAHAATYANHPVLRQMSLVGDVQADSFESVERALSSVRPAVIINCIGVIKQLPAAKDPLPSIAINALFPHRLAKYCQSAGIRLIHISTDCVFSGLKGQYRESDVADANDLYGRTKFLGEVSHENCVTVRTSLIGRELETAHGLIEWFLRQGKKSIRGYTRAVFSGFTTNALANVIERMITKHPSLEGVWHVASEPISKFELLSLVKKVYGSDIQIEPDETFVCDRSLNADRFRQATGFVPPTWPDMITQMHQDRTPYEALRRTHADR